MAKVHGLEALSRHFGRLPDDVEKKILRPALRAGVNVVMMHMRQNIDGLDLSSSAKKKLKRALIVRPIRMRRGGKNRLYFGVKIRTPRTRDPSWRAESGLPWYYHLIESGTKERHREVSREYDLVKVHRPEVYDPRGQKYRRATSYTRMTPIKTMASTGRMKAQPFIQPAIDSAAVRAEVQAAIDAKIAELKDKLLAP